MSRFHVAKFKIASFIYFIYMPFVLFCFFNMQSKSVTTKQELKINESFLLRSTKLSKLIKPSPLCYIHSTIASTSFASKKQYDPLWSFSSCLKYTPKFLIIHIYSFFFLAFNTHGYVNHWTKPFISQIRTHFPNPFVQFFFLEKKIQSNISFLNLF